MGEHMNAASEWSLLGGRVGGNDVVLWALTRWGGH